MERILKKCVISVILVLQILLPVSAENISVASNIPYENCTKVFNIDNLNLFYLTISSINSNKFTVNEIQSKSGYILFTALGKKYLASVVNVNTNQAMLKITPVDNNYHFQQVILNGLFDNIAANLKMKPQEIFVN